MISALLLNIQDWLTLEDVKTTLSELGFNIEGWTVTIPSEESGHGLRYARLMLPIQEAEQLDEIRRVRLKWTTCRIKVLGESDSRCFKYLENGYVPAQYTRHNSVATSAKKKATSLKIVKREQRRW